MKADEYFQRHWAETVRLYSGLLEDDERCLFIKKIAEKDVLLAAECRANSFDKEDNLDDYLSEIAIVDAKDFKNSKTSAKGIMALAELNKFDAIADIFSTIEQKDASFLHGEVVANYISNGSEIQITTFLGVLSKSNTQLYHKAIDKVFELGIYFSPYSLVQANSLINTFLNNNQLLLLAKTICAYQIKFKDSEPNILINIFLKNKLLKYADRLLDIYSFTPKNDIIEYLDDYIAVHTHKDIILQFLRFCKKHKIQLDTDSVRIKLASHLNPQIKNILFEYESHLEISNDLAYDIAMKNIQIANKSSIEFALDLISKYKLSNKISIEKMIDALLNNPKPQRLDLAYKTIIENNLLEKYPVSLIIDLLNNTLDIQSLNLSRNIIKEHFKDSKRDKMLLHLVTIILYRTTQKKLAHDILFNDLSEPVNKLNIKENVKYIGFVSSIHDGFYQIRFSYDNLVVSAPKLDLGRLRFKSFIEFQIISLEDRLSQSKIKILNKDILSTVEKLYLFNNFFVGQILDLEVIRFDNHNIFLKFKDYHIWNFIINIKNISYSYVKDIATFVKIGDNVKAKIIDYDKNYKDVFCSIKALNKKDIKINNQLSNEELIEKIKKIQELLSSK